MAQPSRIVVTGAHHGPASGPLYGAHGGLQTLLYRSRKRLAVLVGQLALSRRKKREMRSRRARKKLLRGMNSVGLFESSGCCGGSIEGYH